MRQSGLKVLQEIKNERDHSDRFVISTSPKGKKTCAVPLVAPAPPHGEPSFARLVLHYPKTKNKFIKAPLKHTICYVPLNDTLVSAMSVYPIPSEHNPIEILKFICI